MVSVSTSHRLFVFLICIIESIKWSNDSNSYDPINIMASLIDIDLIKIGSTFIWVRSTEDHKMISLKLTT